MKKTIDDFIKEHTYINYCEAIISTDGLIQYVKPSHVETMIKITGEDREVIWEKMPIWESPISWLLEYTGCIAVWSNGYLKPIFKDCTKEQLETLNKLVKSKLVSNRDIMESH